MVKFSAPLLAVALAHSIFKPYFSERAGRVAREGEEGNMSVKRITPEEAKELLDSKGYIYLDVRTEREFDAGHVPGAKNIPVLQPDPYGRMALNSDFVGVVKAHVSQETKLITGCQKGARSLKAAQLLLEAGFTNVVDMRGGFGGETDEMGQVVFPGWAPRGLPTTRESAPQDRYENLVKK